MANLLPFLALAASRGLAGFQEGREARRRQQIVEAIQQHQVDRQDRQDAAAEAERAQQAAAMARGQSIQDLQLANPGGAIVPRTRALEPVPMLNGPLGPVAAKLPAVDPNYVTAGDYATDARENAETRAVRTFERQQEGAAAAAERAARQQALIQAALDRRAQMQVDAADRRASMQTGRTDAALAETGRHNRAMEARATQPRQPGEGRPLPGSVTQALVTNQSALQQIDEAIDFASKNPGAFGVSNAMGGAFLKDQIAPNAANTTSRAAVADIGSMEIHNRTGAAMSKSEWARLQPFIPSASDNAETVVTKLRNLRKHIERESVLMHDMYANRLPAGAMPSPAPSADRATTHPVVSKYGITPP
jgi:hypothetical protein